MVLKNRAERTDRKQREPQGAGLGPGLGALRAAVQAAAAQRRLRGGLLPRRPGLDRLCPCGPDCLEGNLSQITQV